MNVEKELFGNFTLSDNESEDITFDSNELFGAPSDPIDDSPIDDDLSKIKPDEPIIKKPITTTNDDDLLDVDFDLDTSKDKTPGNQSSSPFSTLANEFITRGLLPKENAELLKELETVDDWENFFDVYEKYSEVSELKSMTDVQKDYIKALRTGVPTKKFEEYANSIIYLDNLKPEHIADAKIGANIANVYYLNKGITDAEERGVLVQNAVSKGAAHITTLKDALKTTFKSKYDTEVSEYEAKGNLELSTEKASIDKLKSFVTDKELFKGVKLTDKEKQKVIDTAVNIVNDDPEKPLTAITKAWKDSPIETNAKLAYIWVQTNGLTDLSGFTRKGMSAATQALKEITERPVMTSVFDNNNPDIARDAKLKSKNLASIVRNALGH